MNESKQRLDKTKSESPSSNLSKPKLVQLFAARAVKAANKIWDEEDWNEEKVQKLLHTKLRKKN